MPGKSRKRKGKFKQQHKSRKDRQSTHVASSRQEVMPRAEGEIAGIPDKVAVSSPVAEAQIVIKNPELFIELRRIGILAGIMLVALILLVIFLG